MVMAGLRHMSVLLCILYTHSFSSASALRIGRPLPALLHNCDHPECLGMLRLRRLAMHAKGGCYANTRSHAVIREAPADLLGWQSSLACRHAACRVNFASGAKAAVSSLPVSRWSDRGVSAIT